MLHRLRTCRRIVAAFLGVVCLFFVETLEHISVVRAHGNRHSEAYLIGFYV